MNGADVRMIQRGGGSRFPAETFKRLLVFGHFVGKKLERDVAAKIDVFSFVHNAHTTAAKSFNDAVMGNGLADQRIGRLHVPDILGCARRQVNEERYLGRDIATSIDRYLLNE